MSKTIAKGQPYNLWRRLLNAYAALNFTFDSDRLPALYGLAQAMQGLSLGIYCAGLWTDHLPEGLSWYCSKASVARKGRGPYPYQAPTWSWTPSRKLDVPIRPIHYVLVLKASYRVSGAYERIGLTTGWEQWSLHSQEKDFDIV